MQNPEFSQHSGDMPWLDPSLLPPVEKPIPTSMDDVVRLIQAALRSLPSTHDRHRCLGYVIARMIESEHIRSINDVWQSATAELNRHDFVAHGHTR